MIIVFLLTFVLTPFALGVAGFSTGKLIVAAVAALVLALAAAVMIVPVLSLAGTGWKQVWVGVALTPIASCGIGIGLAWLVKRLR